MLMLSRILWLPLATMGTGGWRDSLSEGSTCVDHSDNRIVSSGTDVVAASGSVLVKCMANRELAAEHRSKWLGVGLYRSNYPSLDDQHAASEVALRHRLSITVPATGHLIADRMPRHAISSLTDWSHRPRLAALFRRPLEVSKSVRANLRENT